jgi:hypothetical protein
MKEMDNLTIYGYENSEMSDYEAFVRGHIEIYVKKGEDFFIINVYDIVRLEQDFISEIKNYGFFNVETAIIIVNEVTIKNISTTLEKLDENGFFHNLKPLDKNYTKILELEIL